MYVRVQACAPYTWCATTSQGAPRLAPVARVACKGVLWGVAPATGHYCRRGPHKVENGCP